MTADGDIFSDGDYTGTDISSGQITVDPVLLKSTFYVPLGEKMSSDLTSLGDIDRVVLSQLVDTKNFKFSVDQGHQRQAHQQDFRCRRQEAG